MPASGEKEAVDTRGLPPPHLVDAVCTAADHIVSVWIIASTPSGLVHTDSARARRIAGSGHAVTLFGVLRNVQRHGCCDGWKTGWVFASFDKKSVQHVTVSLILLRSLMARAGGA